ncbi:MAG: hypothetical protein DDT31_00213 [Syntrophomonadaceae bacterium]|nr:hypothetical protein [Bacillota bacterium]
MVTNLKVAEDFILAQLQPLVAQFNIAVAPMSSQVFNKAVTVSNLYVNFVSSTNANINTFNRGYAKDVRFDVLIQLQDLRTHARGYPIMAEVQRLLVGKKPIAGCREIHFIEEKFLTDLVPDGLWVYQMGFGFQIYD